MGKRSTRRMATMLHHPIVYCPENIDAYDFEPQPINFDHIASPQSFYDSYADQARVSQKRSVCTAFPMDENQLEFMIPSGLTPSPADKRMRLDPSIVQAQPVYNTVPSFNTSLPRVIVHTAPEGTTQRLKTFATFPMQQDRPSPEERKYPIVLVLPSDGSQPCVATPILPKSRQAAQRPAISDIQLPDMVEIETQPVPASKKKHAVRRRRTACA